MKRLIYLLFIVGLMQGCASISAPTGGPKDIIAPKLISRNIKDSMLHFTGGKFDLNLTKNKCKKCNCQLLSIIKRQIENYKS